MGKRTRQKSPEFKFRVVMESFRSSSVTQVARQYGLGANQLSNWRRLFTDKGPKLFAGVRADRESQLTKKIGELEKLIGKKEIEINLLKNFLDFYEPRSG
jgi:transposase